MKAVRLIPTIVLTLLLLAASLPPSALPASAPLEKLTLGWSAVAGSQAPFWITKEAGLFEKNGLDVIMIYLDGGTSLFETLTR